MTTKKWIVVGAIFLAVAVTIGLLVYFFVGPYLFSEDFKQMCGEQNQCLWVSQD